LTNELSQLSGLGQAVVGVGEALSVVGKFFVTMLVGCPQADNPDKNNPGCTKKKYVKHRFYNKICSV
jgi:hypothetical protein